MAKKLKIEGVKEIIVTDCQGCCPFNYDCIECKLDRSVDVMFSGTGTPSNCPLPDATEAPAADWPDDENHNLGPNGERLIAVESVPSFGNSMLQFCASCYCFRNQMPCFTCEAEKRSDGRNVHWQLAGDRK